MPFLFYIVSTNWYNNILKNAALTKDTLDKTASSRYII